MWWLIWSSRNPKKAHAHSQWREATQVHTMQLCIFKGSESQRSYQNTLLRKAIPSQMVQLLFNLKTRSFPTSAHPQWREATSLQRVRELIRQSSKSEKAPPHSHWWKTVQVPTMQLLKCSILSSQTTHDQASNSYIISFVFWPRSSILWWLFSFRLKLYKTPSLVMNWCITSDRSRVQAMTNRASYTDSYMKLKATGMSWWMMKMIEMNASEGLCWVQIMMTALTMMTTKTMMMTTVQTMMTMMMIALKVRGGLYWVQITMTAITMMTTIQTMMMIGLDVGGGLYWVQWFSRAPKHVSLSMTPAVQIHCTRTIQNAKLYKIK